MLYGGARVSSLVGQPAPIKYTKSYENAVPTREQERQDMLLDPHVQERMLPLNIHHSIAYDLARLRYRHLKSMHAKNCRTHHPHPSELSIAPKDYRPTEFLPLHSMKTVWSDFSLYRRQSGPRNNPDIKLRQELLNGKGMGWRSQQRLFWQMPIDYRYCLGYIVKRGR